MADNKEWIGCSSCSSVWLGDMADFAYFPNEPCPHCESVGHIGPVQGPSEVDQKAMDEMCASRIDASTWIHCCACQSEWLGKATLFDEGEPCPYCGDKGTVHFGWLENCLYCPDPDGGDCPDDPTAPEVAMLSDALDLLAGAVECVTQYWSDYPEDTPVWVDDAKWVLQQHGKLNGGGPCTPNKSL